MITATERCRTVLLSDLPATHDAFGPHDRLAQTIAEVVSSDQAGSAIALEGGWGSGKSTVVNLLKVKLQDRSNIRLAVFDAWAHQGDPLRRTFLETTITSLEPWIDKNTWDRRRRELSGRLKVTREERSSDLTTWAKLAAFALLLVPIGLALATVNLLTDAPSYARNLLVALGVLLTATPALTVLLRLLLLSVRPSRPRQAGTDTWAVLAGRVESQTVTESSETTNPTSVEFHATFTDLMREALQDSHRQIVLVLDNLDRVDPADALAMWSTLQTFLQHSEHDKPLWLDRVWVLIPYDPVGIRRLWDAAAEVPVQHDHPTPSLAAEVPVQHDHPTPTLAPAFLDKTFQVRYEVPPPVLSQWRDFLFTLLKSALPNHDQADFHAPYRVYALYQARHGSSPAPRDLKLYVNDIGALHQQRQDEFPLCHLGYYALPRRQVTSVAEALRTGGISDLNMQAIVGEGILDSLAALHFNAPVPLARQLLLASPIENALSIGNSESLATLKSANPEAFWAVLDYLHLTGTFSWTQSPNLVNAARCLHESHVLDGETRGEVQVIRSSLRQAVTSIGSWPQFDERTSSGLAALLHLISVDKELTTVILKSISSSPIQEADQTTGVPAQEWARSALAVLRELRSLGVLSAPDSQQVVVPGSPAAWIHTCHQTAQDDPDADLRQYLRPKAQTNEISLAVAEVVSGGAFSEEHANAVRMTVTLPINQSWSHLVAAIQQRLQAPDSVPASEVARLIESLWQLRTVDTSADQALLAIGSQGHALHQLHQAASEGHSQAFAWCAFLFLRTTPAAQPPPAVGNAEAGHTHLANLLSSPQSHPDITAAFLDLLIQTGELPLLFTVLDANRSSQPLVMYCIKLLVKRAAVAHLLTPEVFLLRWSWLSDQLEPEELDALSATLATKTELLTHLTAQQFDMDQAGLCASLVRADATSNNTFRSWCRTGLRSVTQQQWASQLVNEGKLLDLLLDLLERRVRIALELPYMDALADHAKLVVGGTAVPSRYLDSWRRLLEPLSGDHRTMLARRLLAAAIDANGNIHESFFQLYGDEIARPGILRGESRAPDRLFAPLVQSRNTPGLRWLAKVLPSPSRLERQGFEPDTVVYFKDRVRDELSQQQGTEADSLIQQIAQALNIQLPTDDEPDQAG